MGVPGEGSGWGAQRIQGSAGNCLARKSTLAVSEQVTRKTDNMPSNHITLLASPDEEGVANFSTRKSLTRRVGWKGNYQQLFIQPKEPKGSS